MVKISLPKDDNEPVSIEVGKSLFEQMREAACGEDTPEPPQRYVYPEEHRKLVAAVTCSNKTPRRKGKKAPPAAKAYSDDLSHPKWQRKRLEIFNRAEFLCEDCRGEDDTLTVHHCYYEYGVKPWEYDNDTLISLCWGCHQPRQNIDRQAKRLFGKILGSIKTQKEAEKLVKHLEQLVDNGRWK